MGINLEDALGEKVLENGGFLPVVMEDVLMVYITSRVDHEFVGFKQEEQGLWRRPTRICFMPLPSIRFGSYISSRVLPFPPQDSSIFISVLKPQKKYLSTLRAVFN